MKKNLLSPVHFAVWFALSSLSTSPAATFTVTSTNDAGPGTLRQAILDANGVPGSQTIQFNLPGVGVRTITPLAVLPDITNTMVIDGYSQPGSKANTLSAGNDARLLVRLDGSKLTGLPIALNLRANNCVVRGLIIVRFSFGIQLNSVGGTVLAGNWIGMDADGIARGMTFEGVNVTSLIWATASLNLIGGPSPADRNVISGNGDGISFDSSSGFNTVQGNFIGTDPSGTLPRGNVFSGVNVFGSTNITVSQNVLSAATGAGGCGVKMVGATGGTIQGNLIGLAITGTNDLGNSGDGIFAQGVTGVQIGGVASGAGNRIGCNRGNGIALQGGGGAAIQGNLVGTDASGSLPLGNSLAGVYLNSSSSNRVGGLAAGERNTIYYNGGAGVAVTGISDDISGNWIYDNGGLGIDLGNDGVTPNDPGDADTGANMLQNYPVLASAKISGGRLQVTGALDSLAATAFRVELFASWAWDALNLGEGEFFLGSTNVSTDATGLATVAFAIAAPGWLSADYILTATATDPLGNTSEFSPAVGLTVEEAPASLSITLQSGAPLVRWPSAAAGFQLETAPAISPDATWSLITNGITDDGTIKSYVPDNPGTQASQFFRLRKVVY